MRCVQKCRGDIGKRSKHLCLALTSQVEQKQQYHNNLLASRAKSRHKTRARIKIIEPMEGHADLWTAVLAECTVIHLKAKKSLQIF